MVVERERKAGWTIESGGSTEPPMSPDLVIKQTRRRSQLKRHSSILYPLSHVISNPKMTIPPFIYFIIVAGDPPHP